MVTYKINSSPTINRTLPHGEPGQVRESKYEQCVLANLALWLSKPSPACFVIVMDAQEVDGKPMVQHIHRHSPLLCHPNDQNAMVNAEDMQLAIKIHSSLSDITEDSAIWTAVRATWAGLQMNIMAIRYSLFWIAIEALFGQKEPAGEITYRLSQRIGFFLGRDRSEARSIFSDAKNGYRFRSKIVHGQWKKEPDGEERMAEVENLVRRSLRRIQADNTLIEIFSGKSRAVFLDDLCFRS